MRKIVKNSSDVKTELESNYQSLSQASDLGLINERISTEIWRSDLSGGTFQLLNQDQKQTLSFLYLIIGEFVSAEERIKEIAKRIEELSSESNEYVVLQNLLEGRRDSLPMGRSLLLDNIGMILHRPEVWK